MRCSRSINWLPGSWRLLRAVWLACWSLAGALALPGQSSLANDKPTGKPAKSPATSVSKPVEPKPSLVKPQKTDGPKGNSSKSPGSSSKSNSVQVVDGAAKKTERLPADREALAMAFAQQHHPELADLLVGLKNSRPDDFSKAIRELDRTRERLERQQEADSGRYLLLLREWQLDSRVRLLAARMSMGETRELESELRSLLRERQDVRLQLLIYDRDKSKHRLQKLDEQIAEYVESRDVNLDREFDKIKKNAEARKRSLSKAPANRPTEK
jgi:hypothetical protein